MDIMSLDHPDEYPESLYRNYLNLLLSVFHVACRDLSELRHLVRDFYNVTKYVLGFM